MTKMRLLLCASLFLGTTSVRGDAPSYSNQIKPFLARYCVECHSGKEPEGGLDLETYKGLRAGGDNGPVLTVGKPDDSRIVRMVEGKTKPTMPPRKAKQPTVEERGLLRAWIAAGAKEDSASTRLIVPDVRPKTPVAVPVAALAYHPTGKVLVAGRREVHGFDPVSGELFCALGGQDDRVTALAFRPDGRKLVVASSTTGEAHVLRIYDFDPGSAPDGQRGRVIGRHEDVVYALAFHREGTLLASAGYDRVIKLWDLAATAATEPRLLRDHSDAVHGLAFRPDGKLLASASADRAVKVWDLASGKRLYTLGESTDWVYAVAWSPDGRHLAASGVDRSVRVWEVNAQGGRIVHSVFAHDAGVLRLAYSADGKTLFSLSESGGLKAWDSSRMVERQVVYPRQPEAPLALAVLPDGKQLAVGRFDGALVLLNEATGKVEAEPLPLKPKPPVLSRITPSVVARGQTIELKLEGKNLQDVTELACSLPGWKATLVPGPRPHELLARVTVPATVNAGVYPVHVRSPGGQSGTVSLTVDLFADTAEAEPNDSPRTGQKIKLPATLVGHIGRAGDVDYYRFEAAASTEIGVQVQTDTTGTRLEPVLQLIDESGTVLAESSNGLLGHVCAKAGTYALGIRDHDYRGDPGMSYRLHVGPVAVVTSVFPPGVERGKETEVQLEGVNLGPNRRIRVKVPAETAPGTRLPVPGVTALGNPTVVIGEHPEIVAPDPKSNLLPPFTGNGRIARPGATDVWRFPAKKGQRLLIEVDARRMGSPLDSYIEVLDAQGRPLPRATLRALARTYTTFRDHDSTGSGIRIETWSELAMNDYLLVGDELVRIRALPRNPDDDCQFFSEAGQRLAYLGTTPTFHPQGQPMYRVSIHPPGTRFPPNGLPLVTLFYRNDDGGPGFGKDSRLVFEAPADGDYRVRIGDSRGQGGSQYVYRLTVRPPRPDYTISFSPTAPAVARGSAVALTVSAQRRDDFEGPIAVQLRNLPPGFSAPAAIIPEGENSTSFALYAEPKASPPAKGAALQLTAEATIDGRKVTRTAAGGVPTLIEPGDIVTTTEQSEVVVQPGAEVRVTVKVERRNGFKGRIPLEVRGLPHGAHVLDVGLNGILVTEQETTRTFAIQVEPWVPAGTYPFVVLARREGKNTEHAARSVLLRIGTPARSTRN